MDYELWILNGVLNFKFWILSYSHFHSYSYSLFLVRYSLFKGALSDTKPQATARIRSYYVNIALACVDAVRWAIKESLLRHIERYPPGDRWCWYAEKEVLGWLRRRYYLRTSSFCLSLVFSIVTSTIYIPCWRFDTSIVLFKSSPSKTFCPNWL